MLLVFSQDGERAVRHRDLWNCWGNLVHLCSSPRIILRMDQHWRRIPCAPTVSLQPRSVNNHQAGDDRIRQMWQWQFAHTVFLTSVLPVTGKLNKWIQMVHDYFKKWSVVYLYLPLHVSRLLYLALDSSRHEILPCCETTKRCQI